MDPAVKLVSIFTKKVSGPVVPLVRPVGVVRADAGAPGTSVTTDVIAPAGSNVVLLVSAPGAPVAVPFGTVWIDIIPSVVIGMGIVGNSGHRVKKFPLGTLWARGQSLTFQAGTEINGELTVSTPDTVVLHQDSGCFRC